MGESEAKQNIKTRESLPRTFCKTATLAISCSISNSSSEGAFCPNILIWRNGCDFVDELLRYAKKTTRKRREKSAMKNNCDFFVNGTSELGGAERHRHYSMSGRSAWMIVVFCLYFFLRHRAASKQKCSQLWHEKFRSGTATKFRAIVTFQGMCAIVGKSAIDWLVDWLVFSWSIDRLIYWMQRVFPFSTQNIALSESEKERNLVKNFFLLVFLQVMQASKQTGSKIKHPFNQSINQSIEPSIDRSNERHFFQAYSWRNSL